MVIRRARSTFQRFAESEASGGLVLMASAAVGMVVANSVLAGNYGELLHTKVAGLSVLHWINDGLMALFFLLVGLEIKREILVGELDSWPRRALPFIAALGGMIAPALLFFLVNRENPETWRGWAIPTATDIAFALGVLSLFGSRVPNSLKVFLTSLAIIDDLGAILIIALFYAADLSWEALGLAALATICLLALNRFGVMRLWPYLVIGLGLWAAMLFSGIHATLAGVVLAITIPIGPGGDSKKETSPLHSLEHALEPWVAFLVLPIFG
ncbi:MAG: Na+/H+ antiporter NhaA, partial [Methyloceanibacter sp.]